MYEVKEIILKNESLEKKRFVIEFVDPKKQIVGAFLMSDALLKDGVISQEIEKVLADEKEVTTMNGNRCTVTVHKTTTVIEDLYMDVDGMISYPPYEIDTKELLDLIYMWFETVGKNSSTRKG